ncbi:ThiF family adenylyltransferase [Lysinibacillus parviboronicapiens]|uniref:ThiF family adenylyltransferase n=1 Tax=Lysinibacillus parviboronicapiens TaxID=436516 RepID=UPI00142DD990|nr:ThiF family adenylyltransferase [Lysinibacillus parviboronicapiens]
MLDIYITYREQAINHLQTAYGAVLIDSINTANYPASLIIKQIVADIEVSFIMDIPFNFPDAFPKIRLEEQSYEKVYPIPHLSKYKKLCLFDDVEASPNPKNPIGLIEEVIKKTRDILSKGILKQNFDEFIDEFDSYWFEESYDRYLSLVEPSDEIKKVYLVPCFLKMQPKHSGVFADTKSQAIRWIVNAGGLPKEELATEALYVPLKTQMLYPFPNNNKDIYQIIKDSKISNTKEYFSYLDKCPRPSKILFSMEVDDKIAWGVWEHRKPNKQIISLYKGWKRNQKNLNGFRNQSQNSLVELIRDYPNLEINKYYVEDIRPSRLKTRGGDGNTSYQGKKVVVIGCGAVGSHLIQGLFDLGVQQMLLIDPDELSFENINRHLCGADSVGLYKTVAIKKKFQRHYPTCQIHFYNYDVMQFLIQFPKGLNSYDLIISAISHTPIEQRMSELQQQGVITPPILNVWVEPYLAAGHAIWQNSASGVFFDSLFDTGKYKYQVLKSASQYTQRELGCNTSYVPYGVLELKKFVMEVVIFIAKQWEQQQSESIAFTWLGNLTEQRRNSSLLENRWVGASDFSVRHYKLENPKESTEKHDI